MATNNALKNQLANKNAQAPTTGNTLKGLISSEAVKKRFDDVLKDRAPQFLSSLLGLVNNSDLLKKAEPNSVLQSAMIAASLDLPIDPNLGYAWIVPYSGQAQFQLGYKGYIQLALRTGQYKNINVIEVYEGELIKFDRLTEELEIDFAAKKSEKIIGYAAHFELLNGFKKTVYWSKEQVEKHKAKYSKSGYGWGKDWDAMAKKTVLKNMLSKWGILSVEMQKAYADDEKAERIDITEDSQEAEYTIIDAAEGASATNE
jgi:recombination protein RecT